MYIVYTHTTLPSLTLKYKLRNDRLENLKNTYMKKCFEKYIYNSSQNVRGTYDKQRISVRPYKLFRDAWKICKDCVENLIKK